MSGDPSTQLPILLVDDEPKLLRSASLLLRASGINRVQTLEDAREVPGLLEALEPRLQKLDADYRIQNCFLKMKFYDFNQTTVERQHTAPSYADYAMLCEEAWQRARLPVRLLGIGVRLIDLTDASGQMDLFENDSSAGS